MNFVNDKLVKIIPQALGNSTSEKPAAVYVEKLSAVGVSKYAATVKEKELKTNDQIFCLIVSKIENFFLVDPTSGEKKELTKPEEVVEIPGIYPLVSEVINQFGEINNFTGYQKNVQ